MVIEKIVVKKWLDGEISLRSLILHVVGSLFIGTPESMDMPGDFYFIEGDRNVPHPNDYDWEMQRLLLYVDTFRRELTTKVSNLCVILALVFFCAGLVVQGFAGGVRMAVHQVQKTYHSIFDKGSSQLSTDVNSREDAISRLKVLRKRYIELTASIKSDDRDREMMDINNEANQIFSKYPELKSYNLE